MIMKGRRQKGFTLIELIVVVTIIGILAGVAISNVKWAQQRARESALRHDLFEMRKAIDDYYADKQKYPESLAALKSERYLRNIPKIDGRTADHFDRDVVQLVHCPGAAVRLNVVFKLTDFDGA